MVALFFLPPAVLRRKRWKADRNVFAGPSPNPARSDAEEYKVRI
jgi:hypothetical protein